MRGNVYVGEFNLMATVVVAATVVAMLVYESKRDYE
jgi:hypothetical protein